MNSPTQQAKSSEASQGGPNSKTVFISFRRVRYHVASFAYRDLMLSGLVPWMSDLCIRPEDALRFVEDSAGLEPYLVDRIRTSACALIVVDNDYWMSSWTKAASVNNIYPIEPRRGLMV